MYLKSFKFLCLNATFHCVLAFQYLTLTRGFFHIKIPNFIDTEFFSTRPSHGGFVRFIKNRIFFPINTSNRFYQKFSSSLEYLIMVIRTEIASTLVWAWQGWNLGSNPQPLPFLGVAEHFGYRIGWPRIQSQVSAVGVPVQLHSRPVKWDIIGIQMPSLSDTVHRIHTSEIRHFMVACFNLL